MNDRAQRIVAIITDVVDDEDVQPRFPDANGNTNVTWCNRALHRMLIGLGGNADLLLEPRGINWTNANSMLKNARERAERVSDGLAAQRRANDGELIAVLAPNKSGPGHVALVCPDECFDGTAAAKGVLIGQAGARCGIMRLLDGFAHLASEVEYYNIPYNVTGVSA